MKKQSFVLTLAALACTAAFAQAPAGVVATPSAQANPTASGGTPAATAEMKVDAKKANGSTLSAPDPTAGMGGAAANAQINPSASGGTPAARAGMKVEAGMEHTSMNGMDANGDGMVSKKEWDRYHSSMWGKMKMKMKSKNGMVPTADMEAMMKGGPG